MLSHRLRGAIPAALILISSSVAAALPISAAAQPRSHHPSPHRTRHPMQNGIPPHGGGDHDADNSGGPNDGDGNV
jgi:hypothetical protein